MNNVEKFITKIFLIIIISFLWTVIIPGIIAYNDGVFYSIDVEKKVEGLDDREVSQLTKFKDYKLKYDNYNAIITSIDDKIKTGLTINDNNQNKNLEELVKVREIYKKELSELKKPISTIGFYNSHAIYCYLFSYIFLLAACFIFTPPIEKPIKINLFKVFL